MWAWFNYQNAGKGGLSRATLSPTMRSLLTGDLHAPCLSRPKDLTSEQKPLYQDMRTGIESHFKGFVNMRPDGALLGPWNLWLSKPQFSKPVWQRVKAMVSNPTLPATVREVAMLVTGSHFRSGYEPYAHVLVAEQRGLSDEKLATIVAGQRPADLTRQEAVSYDVAAVLVKGGVLPVLTYKAAIEQFGAHGAAELPYLIGVCCMVSVALNTFDGPMPQ
jgi:4-carboxymuconolactone decarboxylase